MSSGAWGSAPGRVLVTGGAGFVGSHLADAYLSEGREVWIADDLSTGRIENVPEGAGFFAMDIADAEAVSNLMAEGGFEIVSHHAAQVDIRRSVADPAGDARTNVIGLVNIARAAAATGVRRLIFGSSGGAIYGEVGRPARESDPKRPMAPYGIAKLAGELYLAHFARAEGLDFVSLRYGNVYGARQDPSGEAGVVAVFCGRLRKGRKLAIYGDGSQQRDYVHVSDVVQANLLLSRAALSESQGADERAYDQRAYNVGSGVATSVSDLAGALESIRGGATGRVRLPARPGELERSVLDTSRLRRLGWEPRISLPEGLAATWVETA